MSDNEPHVVQTAYRQELGERLGLALSRIRTRADAALAAGISGEQLTKWVRGDVKVPAEGLRALALFTNVDFGWLVTGQGEMAPSGRRELHAVLERLGKVADARHQTPTGFIPLPFYQDVSASAGLGLAVPSEQPDSVIAFARSFLRDYGATPEKCSVIRARGDSMTPTIPDASLLIVDHSQTDIANGCIMVINIGDDLLVKRVRRRLDGLVDLVSDNPAYPPETIGVDRIQQLRIVGRVVYFCRTP